MRRRISGLAAALALCLASASGCGGSSEDATGESKQEGSAGEAGAAGSAGEAGAGGGELSTAFADLRVDSDRDGKIDLDGDSDEEGEDAWSNARGAVFLANIDDDQSACPTTKIDDAGKTVALTDDELAACNDAVDEVINGPDDLLDLARIEAKAWPDAPDDATGKVTVSKSAAAKVRLFKRDAQGNFTKFDPDTTALSADELRAGVALALEGKDILRDESWDGYVDITLTVQAEGAQEASDTVRLRLAPIITRHHLDPAEQVYVAKLSGAESTLMRNDLKAAAEAAGVPQGVDELPSAQVDWDQWTQDYFETGYMSMPGEGGQHVMHVFYRSANVFSTNKRTPLRPAGRVVFTKFRGKDVAGVQQYDIKHDEFMDSLNSFGNTETIPPYALGDKSYPLGRLLRGSTKSFYPDPTFSKLMESQRVQPPVYINTEWLLVGHVDETISFVKASTPRGWALVVNDAALAKQMLEEQQSKGNGGVKLFVGKKWMDDNGKETVAETTIDEVLANTNVMKASQEAIAEVDGQLEIIKAETGLTDDEIIRIPYLHESISGYSIAYQPGTVNGISLSDTHFGAPDPHGPLIDGQDIFKVQFEEAFAKQGITVHWIEDWDLYHRLSGEVHCGTNTKRKIPENVRWWESSFY